MDPEINTAVTALFTDIDNYLISLSILPESTAVPAAATARLNHYRHKLATAEQTIADLTLEAEGSGTAINALRTELAQQKTIAHALALSHEPGTGGSTSKGPELFSGNFKVLRSFIMKLRLKTSN